jgi:hypothetical protein
MNIYTRVCIIVACSFIYFLITFFSLCTIESNSKWISGFNFLNPVEFYKNIKVNLFGAFFVTFIFNALLAPYAIIYWIYKLCTVGRR